MSKLGHEQPEFDNRALPEESLFTYEKEFKDSSAEPIPEEVVRPERTPVADIMAEHEQRVEQRARRFEELTDSNWPPGRIEEKLDIEFPDLKTPETIEREEVKRIADRLHASHLHKPKSKVRRSPTKFSPRDTGPPLHIAEDVRRDQGLIA